jgi:hypothetical protein
MRLLMAALFFLLLPITTAAQLPAFESYRVTEHFKGRPAKVILTGVDQDARDKVKAAAKQKPNFAGHYVIVTWSCGNECLAGSVIDAATGKVFSLPVTVCCWKQETGPELKPIEFHLDSRLLVLQGGRNGKGCDFGQHYYELKEDHFELIKTTSAQQCP